MAKRKATRALRRRAASKKAAGRKRTAPKRRAAAKPARKARKPAPRARTAKRPAARKRVVNRARKRLINRARRRPVVKASTPARPRPKAKPVAQARPVAKTAAVKASRRSVPIPRKPPSLDRKRLMVREDDIIQSTPPSSLDLDRSASAVRTGRRALKNRFDEHTETSPALTAGDVDADWESAYSVGDEAPGGDNPTPDQDIVDDIGRAVGVEYQDNEELKGEEKIIKRDKNRWELDPASSDDWDDR